MVVKKDQLHALNAQKKQRGINAFEKIFFIMLTSLSLLFLLITCWLLLTGDDVIFLHAGNITPRHLLVFFSVQSFFPGQVPGAGNENKSDADQLIELF
ncbi:MAG: hypothetical protein D3914_08610 [Candidatus Electrothrix sp. LOE2]|nr:hypothetical protein [Candidatus Electrothrix sp. LOE2]